MTNWLPRLALAAMLLTSAAPSFGQGKQSGSKAAKDKADEELVEVVVPLGSVAKTPEVPADGLLRNPQLVRDLLLGVSHGPVRCDVPRLVCVHPRGELLRTGHLREKGTGTI